MVGVAGYVIPFRFPPPHDELGARLACEPCRQMQRAIPRLDPWCCASASARMGANSHERNGTAVLVLVVLLLL